MRRLSSIPLTGKSSKQRSSDGANNYRFITPETGDVRFTQTQDAFYVIALTKPTETFVVDVPVPILSGDTISMIGAGNGTLLDWSITSDKSFSITVPSALADAGKYAWAMKVNYST